MPAYANAVNELIMWLRTTLAGRPEVELTGVTVAATVPTTRIAGSPPLIVVRRSGGTAVDVRDRPRLDVLTWHSSEFKAMAVAGILRSLLLHSLPVPGRVLGGFAVYDVDEFAGPAAYTDPAGSDLPVVMFTVEIDLRMGVPA